MKKLPWDKIFVYGFMIVLLLFIVQTVRTCKKESTIEEQSSLINSLNDSVKITKNKDGSTTSKVETIRTKDPDDFIKIKNLTGDNKKLQEAVIKYEKQLKNGGSVTNFSSVTETKIVEKTIVDTIIIDSTRYLTYSGNFNKGGWVIGSVKANPDSIKVDLKVNNEYTVVIGEDKQGFLGLGKAKPFTLITNANIYSTTPTMKTYAVDTRTGNKWIVPSAIAFALGVVGGIILLNQ